MSADHTITTKNRTEEIAETTQKLLHDYFERSGSASLINRLAPYSGSAKKKAAEKRKPPAT